MQNNRCPLCQKSKTEQNFSGTMARGRAPHPTTGLSRTLPQGGDDVVESRARVHGCICLCLVNPVVSTEINRRSLAFDQLIQDGRLLLPQGGCRCSKCSFEIFVVVLLGQLFGPVSRYPVVAASVVDLLHLPRGILVRSQESPNSLVKS